MKPPAAPAFRLVGPARAHAAGRVELPVSDDADAVCVALDPQTTDLAAIAAALPDPQSLAARALVIIPGATFERPSFGARLRAVMGKAPTVARSERCGALLARGYVDIGASTDPDLAWGFATGPC